MRKVLDLRDESGELRVNFVQSIIEFEERFLAEDDKNFLLRILKSLARGNLVMVKKMPAPGLINPKGPAVGAQNNSTKAAAQ